MILYNVTVGIDKEIENEWVVWMKETHIPKVMNSKVFVSYKFYKVLTHDDENTVSFCVQYLTHTIEDFNRYLKDFAPAMVAEHQQKYPGKHVAFRTLLEEVV